MQLQELKNVPLFGAKIDFAPAERQGPNGRLGEINVYVHDASYEVDGDRLLHEWVSPSIMFIKMPEFRWVIKEALQDAYFESLREHDQARRALVEHYMDLVNVQEKPLLFTSEWNFL